MIARLQTLSAYGIEISQWGGAFIAVGMVGWHGLQIVIGHTDVMIIFLIFVAMMAALPLGWIFGGLAFGIFFRPIIWRMNEMPCKAGTMVRVLRGVQRGKVVEVYDLWESRGEARVRLGEEAEKDFSDVLGLHTICRVKS